MQFLTRFSVANRLMTAVVLSAFGLLVVVVVTKSGHSRPSASCAMARGSTSG